MKKCPRCETLVSIWQRDLFSGICRKCRVQAVVEQERIHQEAEASRLRAIANQVKAQQDRDNEQCQAASQREFREQLQQQRTHSSALPPCPDCGAALVEIKLFGRGAENPLSGAAIDTAVVYFSDADASRSWGFAMLKEKGMVRATICPSCHRIFLYGVPLERSS